ncbi:MAG: hypothetical protein HYS12_15400 [Planctomycetes bacterium]|nr:hypothetical protein [Planctomycetota bacterium]
MKHLLHLPSRLLLASGGCKPPGSVSDSGCVPGGLHPPLANGVLLLGLLLGALTARAGSHELPRSDEAGRRAQRERLYKMTQAEREDFFRGKNPREVRDLIGPPQRIARQLFYQGRLEQWTYDDLCRVEFLCPLGKEAQFQGVHSLSKR